MLDALPNSWWDARTLDGQGLTPSAAVIEAGQEPALWWLLMRVATSLLRAHPRWQVNVRGRSDYDVDIAYVDFRGADGEEVVQFGVTSILRLAGDPDTRHLPAGVPWPQYLQAVLDHLSTHDSDGGGGDPADDLPARMFELSVLLRSRLGTALPWGIAREYRPGTGSALVRALDAHPDNPGHGEGECWLVIADEGTSAEERLVALRSDGMCATPDGPVDVAGRFEAGASLFDVAVELESALLGYRTAYRHAVDAITAEDDAAECGGLPFNRKERFFTGTVLPGLLAADGLQQFAALLAVLGARGVGVPAGEVAYPTVQLFSEYSLGESVRTDEDRQRFGWSTHEAPDLVAWVPGSQTLVVVEAKMYHQPSPDALAEQLRRQQELVNQLVGGLKLDRSSVTHCVLLPEPFLARNLPALPTEVVPVAWEALLAVEGIAPYWKKVLTRALRDYSGLRSTAWQPGTPYEHRATGRDLAAGVQTTYAGWWVGRRMGTIGVRNDVSNGDWRTRKYPVRQTEPTPNTRGWWLAVTEFAALTGSTAGDQ